MSPMKNSLVRKALRQNISLA